jgi:DNA processing protein
LHIAGGDLGEYQWNIAVVGSRKPSVAGREICEALTRGLAEAGLTIVSGMALGIDAIAHRTALEVGAHTIAVLGCGLDVVYPKRNERLLEEIKVNGTVITEYPNGTPPAAAHFPQRNRIIAGIAKATLIVEGGERSGALITARIAVDANRYVYAVPGSIRSNVSEAPNQLIRTSKATLVTKVEHILDELVPDLVWKTEDGVVLKRPPTLESPEVEVLFLLDDVPASPDQLLRHCDFKPGKLAMLLSKLEVRGLALGDRGRFCISGAGARARKALSSQESSAGGRGLLTDP